MSFLVVAEPSRSRCHTALLLASTLVLFAVPLLQRETAPAQTCQIASRQVTAGPVEPALAVDFVRWWLSKALDCNARTKVASHLEATRWTDLSAADYCDSVLWADDRLEGPVRGSVAFHPQSLRVISVGPGGTVWVDARGIWARDDGFQVAFYTDAPAQSSMEMIILVRRGKSGLRIAKSCLINDAQGCELEAFLHDGASRSGDK